MPDGTTRPGREAARRDRPRRPSCASSVSRTSASIPRRRSWPSTATDTRHRRRVGRGRHRRRGVFTHLAIRQADVAVADILGREAEPLNLDALSSVTFTDPEIGAVGTHRGRGRCTRDQRHGRSPSRSRTPPGLAPPGRQRGAASSSSSTPTAACSSARRRSGRTVARSSVCSPSRSTADTVATLRSMIYAYPTFHKGIEDALNELA